MDKLQRFLCVLLVLVLCFPIPASAQEELSLASEAAVLMDADSGQVLYAKNMNKQLYPASITKIMTALVALQELKPQERLTVSKAAVNAVPRSSSHISLAPGEELTVEQLMFALGMESANDAANVLAEGVSGSLAAFADRMNQEAAKLGAVNTHFTNANGLPDSKHLTTAYDMALITAAAMKQPGFLEFFSTVEYLMPATNLSDAKAFTNKDRLLPGGQYYYEGVLMAKTGWTTSAQGTFAAAVRRGDTTLIAVTLKSPMLEDKYKDTWKLLDYGFSHYTRYSISGEELAAMLPVGEYVAAGGQEIAFQVPADTDMKDITFSLAQELDGETPRVDAVLSAVLGDTELPAPTLVLELPSVQEPTQFLEHLEEELAEELEVIAAEAASLPWSRILLCTGGAVLGIYTVLFLRRRKLRRERRRQLEAKIRWMKKQMKKGN